MWKKQKVWDLVAHDRKFFHEQMRFEVQAALFLCLTEITTDLTGTVLSSSSYLPHHFAAFTEKSLQENEYVPLKPKLNPCFKL